jgi:hypothetical protein
VEREVLQQFDSDKVDECDTYQNNWYYALPSGQGSTHPLKLLPEGKAMSQPEIQGTSHEDDENGFIRVPHAEAETGNRAVYPAPQEDVASENGTDNNRALKKIEQESSICTRCRHSCLMQNSVIERTSAVKTPLACLENRFCRVICQAAHPPFYFIVWQ